MKKISILSLLFLSILHSIVFAQSIINKKGAFGEYINQENSFSFKYNKSWTVMTPVEVSKKTKGKMDTKDVVVFIVYDNDPDRNVNIKIHDIPRDNVTKSELSELKDSLDRQYPNMFRNFKKVSSRIVSISGVNALEYVMDTDRLSTTMRQKSLMIIKNQKNYVLTFTSQKTHYNKADTDCFQIIQSTFMVE